MMNFKPGKLDEFIEEYDINWECDINLLLYTFATLTKKVTIPSEDIVKDPDQVIETLKRVLEIEEVKQ